MSVFSFVLNCCLAASKARIFIMFRYDTLDYWNPRTREAKGWKQFPVHWLDQRHHKVVLERFDHESSRLLCSIILAMRPATFINDTNTVRCSVHLPEASLVSRAKRASTPDSRARDDEGGA